MDIVLHWTLFSLIYHFSNYAVKTLHFHLHRVLVAGFSFYIGFFLYKIFFILCYFFWYKTTFAMFCTHNIDIYVFELNCLRQGAVRSYASLCYLYRKTARSVEHIILSRTQPKSSKIRFPRAKPNYKLNSQITSTRAEPKNSI